MNRWKIGDKYKNRNIEKKEQKVKRPRQDSNLQSSGSKPDALSIRPRGLSYKWQVY